MRGNRSGAGCADVSVPIFASGDSLPAPSCPCGVRRSKMFMPFLRRCPADIEEAASKGALPARSCRSVSGHFRALRPGPYPDFTLDNRLYQGFAKAQEGPLIWPLLPGQNPTLATPPCRPIYERLLLKFGLPEASEASSSIESAIKRVQQIERSGRPRSQHRHGEPSRRSCRLGAVVLGIVGVDYPWPMNPTNRWVRGQSTYDPKRKSRCAETPPRPRLRTVFPDAGVGLRAGHAAGDGDVHFQQAVPGLLFDKFLAELAPGLGIFRQRPEHRSRQRFPSADLYRRRPSQ